jgi:hypothetical protein
VELMTMRVPELRGFLRLSSTQNTKNTGSHCFNDRKQLGH